MRQYFESESDSLEATRRHFVESLRFPPLMTVAVIWLVHFWQMSANWDPADFGIISRRVYGLRGVVTGPLVHGGLGAPDFQHPAFAGVDLDDDVFLPAGGPAGVFRDLFFDRYGRLDFRSSGLAYRGQRRHLRSGGLYFLERYFPAQHAIYHPWRDRDVAV